MSVAIIDADSYLYKAATGCTRLVDAGGGIYYQAYDINIAEKYLREFAEEVTAKVGCDSYVFVVGNVGNDFRRTLYPNYKKNRKRQTKPIMLDKVKKYCWGKFPIVYTPCLEADDTCRIYLENNPGSVIVSIDKDLKTVSGKIYDSYHGEMRYVSPQQAEANFKRQLLMGDSSDGYAGIPGVGKATADKLLLQGITVDEIAQMYIDAGLTLEDFEEVYNCAKILGKNDYNEGLITLYGGKKFDTRNK